jgi:hypothetical protein
MSPSKFENFKLRKTMSQVANELSKDTLNIEVGNIYWTQNIVYFPIQVKVLENDEVNKKAKIEQGWINFDRLYKSKEECPQR